LSIADKACRNTFFALNSIHQICSLESFAIHTPYIQLNQLLKVLGWADSGSEANEMILDGLVKVNGEIELRKRNKILPGFTVTVGDQSILIQSA
jgi:ribosome-associated protein